MNRPPLRKKNPSFKNNTSDDYRQEQNKIPYIKKVKESKVYGLNACKAFFKSRPHKIIRAFFLAHITSQFPETLSYLASQKKVYRILPSDEMEKVSQTTHHEGVVFIVEQTPSLIAEEWIERWKSDTDCLVILENVGNPHNLGAIMRTCSHFGVTAICTNDAQILQSGAALRTAEGGGESIICLEYKNLENLIQSLKKKSYSVITTSSHQGQNLFKSQLPKKCAILFGEEANGLTEPIFKIADMKIQIPGTQSVESLNVANSVAVTCAEFFRQHRQS